MTYVYMPNVSVETFYKICNNHLILKETLVEVNFYSGNGVFSLKNHKFYNITYTHKPIESIQQDNILLYKDPSTTSYSELYSHIPNDLDVVKIKKYIFYSKEYDNVHYVTVFKDDILYDCYIVVSSKIDNTSLFKSAVSFLSL